jgi:hypothetical protein
MGLMMVSAIGKFVGIECLVPLVVMVSGNPILYTSWWF